MRFGVANCEIAPPFPTTMGGYGARQGYFTGVNDPLTFTAVVLEDEGRRALIGAADLINWPNDGRTERLIDRLAKALDADAANIVLNASHTHGGPKVPGIGHYSRTRGDVSAAERYADWLADRVVDTATRAAATLQPGTIRLHHGRTALPMNRRRAVDGTIVNAPNPTGPVDDQLQLLAIHDRAGQMAALIGRLSCHPVATGPQYLLTADWVGAWRDAVRAALPGVLPIFLQGAAGEMRPAPAASGAEWRVLSHGELPAIGRAVAVETLAAIEQGYVRELGPLLLQGHVRTAAAPCERRYTTAADVRPLLDHPGASERSFAAACLELLNAGRAVPDRVDFRVQTLWLDRDLALVGLNCEPLIAVGTAIEQAFAPRQAIVLGYTAGSICYAPDTEELHRGGYEAESYLFEPWTGPWSRGFEHTFRASLVTAPE
jgi:hypothetical protein